ncbi:MAG TPA: PaaI family thioesterase [Candidatus Thermoplasmatota archaeon]|nr:PaaI family thioesterase [Candidatus Thermoplasmatota archaeon]
MNLIGGEGAPGGVADDALENANILLRIAPYHQWLGVQLVEVEKGRVVLRLPFRPEFVGNPMIPAYHGGITAALVDLSGGVVLFSELRIPTPTIDMRVDYLRPALAGKALIAEARVRAIGKTVAHVDVVIHDEDGREVATGTGVYTVKDLGRADAGTFPIG